MSSSLYRAAAGAEFVGVVVYAVGAVFCAASAAYHWGGAWFPLLAVCSVISCRMSRLHLKERNRLLREAQEIEDNE